MEVASKELFSYHKLSASPVCIPKVNLCRCGTIGTYDEHIYPASQARPMWNSKSFLHVLFFPLLELTVESICIVYQTLLSHMGDPPQNTQLYMQLQEYVLLWLQGN